MFYGFEQWQTFFLWFWFLESALLRRKRLNSAPGITQRVYFKQQRGLYWKLSITMHKLHIGAWVGPTAPQKNTFDQFEAFSSGGQAMPRYHSFSTPILPMERPTVAYAQSSRHQDLTIQNEVASMFLRDDVRRLDQRIICFLLISGHRPQQLQLHQSNYMCI